MHKLWITVHDTLIVPPQSIYIISALHNGCQTKKSFTKGVYIRCPRETLLYITKEVVY